MNKPRICDFYYNDTDIQQWHVLLVPHTLVDRNKHVEVLCGAPEKVAVLKGGPTLFLCSTNEELRQIAAELARHVFIEQYAFHAICANAARAASSRKATA